MPKADEVSRKYIIFNVDFFQDDDPDEIEDRIEDRIGRIEDHINWLNADINELNEELEQEARRAIQRRRDELDKKSQILDDLDVDDGDAPSGFVKPEKRREIEIESPVDVDQPTAEVLPDETLRDVLGVIDDMGISLERSASALRGLDEESLRDVILGAINTHYAGLASGETFNREGKTDILLRHDNTNLFIAECKFWRGESKHHDTIDQLLEYLTVRDTHAALIIFSDRQDFSRVEERVREETQAHNAYETKLPEFTDHNVYRFEQSSKTPVKVATKVFDVST
jgi:hypothetical protein